MRNKKQAGVTVVVASLAMLGLAQPAQASSDAQNEPHATVAPGSANASADELFTQDIREVGSTASPTATARAAAALCVATSVGDRVHVSSDEGKGREVSGHGWWTKGTCKASTATVSVQMQAYFSDGKWRNVGYTNGPKKLKPGGGGGNRTTARVGCKGYNSVSFRTVIDVDVDGIVDSPDKLTTGSTTLSCTL